MALSQSYVVLLYASSSRRPSPANRAAKPSGFSHKQKKVLKKSHAEVLGTCLVLYPYWLPHLDGYGIHFQYFKQHGMNRFSRVFSKIFMYLVFQIFDHFFCNHGRSDSKRVNRFAPCSCGHHRNRIN